MSVKERLGLVVCIASDEEEEDEMDVESKCFNENHLSVGYKDYYSIGRIIARKNTQQNSYSISHLLGTVTTQ